MDYTYLKVIIEKYSLPTMVIAGIVSIFMLIYDIFASKHVAKKLSNYLPFLLAVILYLSYDMIFVAKGFKFNVSAVSAGILSGSLSVIVNASIKRLKEGKLPRVNAIETVIESLICAYVKKELLNQTAVKIKQAVQTANGDIKAELNAILTENLSEPAEENELNMLSSLILKAVTALS